MPDTIPPTIRMVRPDGLPCIYCTADIAGVHAYDSAGMHWLVVHRRHGQDLHLGYPDQERRNEQARQVVAVLELISAAVLARRIELLAAEP